MELAKSIGVVKIATVGPCSALDVGAKSLPVEPNGAVNLV